MTAMNLSALVQSPHTRRAVAILLILHGLAHIAIGSLAQDSATGFSLIVSTMAFAVVVPGFVAAGFGAFGVRGFASIWTGLVRASVFASFALLIFDTPSVSRWITALVVDMVVLAYADGTAAPPSAWTTEA